MRAQLTSDAEQNQDQDQAVQGQGERGREEAAEDRASNSPHCAVKS